MEPGTLGSIRMFLHRKVMNRRKYLPEELRARDPDMADLLDRCLASPVSQEAAGDLLLRAGARGRMDRGPVLAGRLTGRRLPAKEGRRVGFSFGSPPYFSHRALTRRGGALFTLWNNIMVS